MGRSTFDGPILVGDNRYGPQRNLGLVRLKQFASLNFTNSVAGTAQYSGGSGQFVASNTLPNTNASIITPGGNTASPVFVTPTADAATAMYRGCVFYIPKGSIIDSMDFDVTAVLGSTGGTTPAYAAYISNTFATSAGVYATVSLTNTAGARTGATFTAAQYPAAQSTLADVNISGQSPLSQIVVTFAFTAASGTLSAPTGVVGVSLSYTLQDPNLGSYTTYPYGSSVG